MKLLTELYKDKKVCLLGTGGSLSKHNINFNLYDMVVGINRIYQTQYIKNINILYHGFGIKDRKNMKYMLDTLKKQKNFLYLIACPWHKKRIKNIKRIIEQHKFYNNQKYFVDCHEIMKSLKMKKRPLTGVAVLNHIILSQAQQIDIFGFDFYEHNYIDNLAMYNYRKFHDIYDNKRIFNILINQYANKINYFN